MVLAEMTMTDNTDTSRHDSNEVNNLTEVLKIQAEALARISERMAGTPSQPQGGGRLPLALPPRMEGISGHFPALADDPSLGEESLPVLNAFRRFLEAERRKARVRFLWLTLIFVGVIAATLVAAYFFWNARVNRIDEGVKSAQDTAALAVASQSNVIAAVALAAASQSNVVAEARDAAGKEARAAAAKAQNSMGVLREDVKAHLLAAQSNLVTEAAVREGEIERLKESVASLQLENAVLISQIKDMLKKMEEARSEPEPATTAPDEPRLPESTVRESPVREPLPQSGGMPAPVSGKESPKASQADGPLTIVAPGLSRTVEMRLPPGP